MRDDLTITQFLERVTFMPLEEAETELVLRKDKAQLELGVLQSELHRLGEFGTSSKRKSEQGLLVGRAMFVVSTDLSRLSEAIKVVRRKIDDTSWRRAITAVYGQEGYEKCRLWMAINTPMEPARAEDEIAHLRAKGVTLD